MREEKNCVRCSAFSFQHHVDHGCSIIEAIAIASGKCIEENVQCTLERANGNADRYGYLMQQQTKYREIHFISIKAIRKLGMQKTRRKFFVATAAAAHVQHTESNRLNKCDVHTQCKARKQTNQPRKR